MQGREIRRAVVVQRHHLSIDNAVLESSCGFRDRREFYCPVEALARQTSPIVQMALIDFVVDARLTAAKDALSRLAMDQSVHQAVRARAERGLREVSS